MADFSKPLSTDLVANIFGIILQDIHTTLAKMFDGTTDTNVPTGATKFNSTNSRIEQWDGAAWQPKTIGNLVAGAVVTASLAANAVDDTKFRTRSPSVGSNYIRTLNDAAAADI